MNAGMRRVYVMCVVCCQIVVRIVCACWPADDDGVSANECFWHDGKVHSTRAGSTYQRLCILWLSFALSLSLSVFYHG